MKPKKWFHHLFENFNKFLENSSTSGSSTRLLIKFRELYWCRGIHVYALVYTFIYWYNTFIYCYTRLCTGITGLYTFMYWYKCVFLEFTRTSAMRQCHGVVAASLCALLLASRVPSAVWPGARGVPLRHASRPRCGGFGV